MNIPDFPALRPVDVEGAVLYANSDHLLASLQLPQSPRVAEVGVGLGDFSVPLLRALKPAEFHAFDPFLLREDAPSGTLRSDNVFRGKSHEEYYRELVAPLSGGVTLHRGPIGQNLRRVPGDFFDLIRLNSSQSFEELTIHANEASRLLRDSGVLLFKNYTLYDPFQGTEYGIVPVVNSMVVHEGWKVTALVLQKHLFCDILLTRPR